MTIAAAPAGAAELYHLIAEGIPNMVWTARPDGGLDFFNRRVFEYTGLTSAELKEWGWRDVIHPADWEMCEARWRRSLGTGESYEIEFRVRRGDGSYRWHIGAALPLRNAEGAIERWFGTCTDIEEEKRANNARYRALVELSPDAIIIRHGDLFAYANDAALCLLGVRAVDELLGKSIYDLVHPDDLALARRRQVRLDDLGEADSPAELRLRRGDGTYVAVEAMVAPMEFDGRKAAVAIWRDLTVSKRSERVLRDSESALREAQRLAHLGSWEWDPSTDTVTWSEEMYRIFGRDPDAGPASYAEHPALYTLESWERLREAVAQALQSGASYELELELASPGRLDKWVVARGEAVRDGMDAIIGLRGTAQDVTDRRRTRKVLQDYSERVKQLLYRLVDTQESERRNLASSLHDLIGQKLTALNIGLDILKRDLHATAGPLVRERIESMATIVDETVDAIRGVMDDLHPSELEDFGLVPALHSHAKRFEANTGIRTAVDAVEPGRRLPVKVELALFRVVQEALTNVIKHSGATRIRIGAWEDAGRAFISIDDNGRGFSDPDGARLARRGGWGLSEMRKRAEAVGGTLKIEFPAEGGTRVLVEVPRHRDAD